MDLARMISCAKAANAGRLTGIAFGRDGRVTPHFDRLPPDKPAQKRVIAEGFAGYVGGTIGPPLPERDHDFEMQIEPLGRVVAVPGMEALLPHQPEPNDEDPVPRRRAELGGVRPAAPAYSPCGDVAQVPHSISLAVRDGAWAGAHLHRSLVWPED